MNECIWTERITIGPKNNLWDDVWYDYHTSCGEKCSVRVSGYVTKYKNCPFCGDNVEIKIYE